MKTKFTSYKQYLFGLLFCKNAKKVHTDQIILQVFLLCLKRSVLQTFESSSCNKHFAKCLCYFRACFDECFLFHVIIGRNIFYKNLLLAEGPLEPPCCRFFWNKCFERSPYFISFASTIIL